jgi:adenosine deaminase
VLLGRYADRGSHPLESLRQAGVRVSINTDDPALMGHSLVTEYVETANAYGWDMSVVREVARTSIEAAFCTDEVRRRLLDAT